MEWYFGAAVILVTEKITEGVYLAVRESFDNSRTEKTV